MGNRSLDSTNRAHWLVIDKLARRAGPGTWTTRSSLPDGVRQAAFDLVRRGNTVDATTRGVVAFTLLVSPDAFNLDEPVKVVANGRTLFEGKVAPSLGTC